jgi:hypothetical protein
MSIELSVWTSILGVLASSAISIVIALKLGPWHVEKMRLRREHAQKLLEGGLKPWLNELHMFCRLGAEYSKDDKKFMPFQPTNPNQMLFVDLMAHLTTGYGEVAQEWANYKTAIVENNQKWADFFNELSLKIEESTSLPKFHFYVQESKPRYFVAPVNVVSTIYNKVRYEIVNGQPWVDRITSTRTMEGDFAYYSISSSYGELGHVNSVEDLDSVIKKAGELEHSKEVRAKMEELIHIENDELTKKRTMFEDKLKELIRSVELGNCLKGKCKYCP